MDIIRLRGIGVSPGIAMGEVFLTEAGVFTGRKEPIPAGQVAAELDRLKTAVARTRADLQVIKEKIREKAGRDHSIIFDAHLLTPDDQALNSQIESLIRDERAKTEWALSQVNKRYQELFESINDEYFRQRKADISDVLAKINRNLETKRKEEAREDPEREMILAGHDLLPSEAALRLSRG